MLQPLLARLVSDFKVAYLDDLTLGGSLANVLSDVRTADAAQLETGLVLNASKCEIFLSGGTLAEREDAVANVRALLPAVRVTAAIDVLGAPLSAEAFVTCVDQKLRLIPSTGILLAPQFDARSTGSPSFTHKPALRPP